MRKILIHFVIFKKSVLKFCQQKLFIPDTAWPGHYMTIFCVLQEMPL